MFESIHYFSKTISLQKTMRHCSLNILIRYYKSYHLLYECWYPGCHSQIFYWRYERSDVAHHFWTHLQLFSWNHCERLGPNRREPTFVGLSIQSNDNDIHIFLTSLLRIDCLALTQLDWLKTIYWNQNTFDLLQFLIWNLAKLDKHFYVLSSYYLYFSSLFVHPFLVEMYSMHILTYYCYTNWVISSKYNFYFDLFGKFWFIQ